MARETGRLASDAGSDESHWQAIGHQVRAKDRFDANWLRLRRACSGALLAALVGSALTACSASDAGQGSDSKAVGQIREALGETSDLTFTIIGIRAPGNTDGAPRVDLSLETDWDDASLFSPLIFRCE